MAHVQTNYVESEPLDVIGQSAPNDVSVLVIGSGIGGLSAARELFRVGCKVRVFERQPHELLSGDSFTIGPSALASLRNFPWLEQQVDALGYDPIMFMHNLNGALIKGPMERSDMLTAEAKKEIGRHLRRHSRPLMYKAMATHAQRLGISIEYGKDVAGYFEDAATGRAGVVVKDGSRYEADLVIAADGVHSQSKKIVLGEDVPTRPSGEAVFRVSYPVEIISQDPVVSAEYPLSADGRPQVKLYAGPDIQIGVSRTSLDMAWTIMHKDDGRARESWDHHPPVAKALELLGDHKLPEALRHVMLATPSNLLVDYRIVWRDPQPKWTSPAGRILQLGDAAHTFHPNSGNGGTQAVEDAISIAKCISVAGTDGVPWATRVSALLRFERVSCLQAFGIYNTVNRKKTGVSAELGRWIISHDPEAYASEKYEEALKHLQEGKSVSFQNTNVPPGMVYRPWSIDTLVEEKERGEPTVLDGDWS